MSEKRDIKKLNRKELLEVLTAVSAENERLLAHVADLETQLEEAAAHTAAPADPALDTDNPDPSFAALKASVEKSVKKYLAAVKRQANDLLAQAHKEADPTSAPAPEPEPEPEPTAPEAAPEPEPESERGCDASG